MNTPFRNELKNTKILCGELCQSNSCNREIINLLNYDNGGIVANVSTKFDKFVDNPQELPDIIIDLLQIASFVFCADRQAYRGARDSLSNKSWGRSMYFEIPVNDINFWSSDEVIHALENALAYMTGDRQYHFTFVKATKNNIKDSEYQLSLFSDAIINIAVDTDVMLFSGGLDSLAGAIERLNQLPERNLCLVTHMSNNRTMKTQKTLIAELQKKYNNRIFPYFFECRFKKLSSIEESQRTRMFLFSAIAFAICSCYNKSEFYVYENGITSINLPKQTDVINARASRTTHPKTIGLLRDFYNFFDPNFKIITPYSKSTKEEIAFVFKTYGEEVLIQSSVSCSSTRNVHNIFPNCGYCSQCIDRRFAMYAAGLAEDFDNTFSVNVPYDKLNEEANQRVSSTLLFASNIGETKYDFLKKYPTELLDVLSYWPKFPEDSLDEVFQLYCKYKESIQRATKTMQASFDLASSHEGSLFDRIMQKLDYDNLKQEDFEQCVESSVYVIENKSCERQGSGFYLLDYGVLTSQHLTEDGDFYFISKYTDYPDSFGTISKELNEICKDQVLDYALYDQCRNCNHYFHIGDSDTLNIGDQVKLIGFPNFIKGDSYDLRFTHISKKTQLFGAPLFAVSNSIFHGASGGVVLDKDNKIVGVIRAGIETSAESELFDKPGFVPINLIISDIDNKGG
ncbi:MAG: serine protease [Bacillota bacterium]|nr:serine protease [Bacillota bacterium]